MTRSIFVFGSNRQGRHGKGAAAFATKHHGAVYGQAEGLQGDSYAIVTKELRSNRPPVTIDEIRQGVERFLAFARGHPDWTFTLTAIGTGLAGFTVTQISPLFDNAPDNILLPPEFK